MSRHLHHDADHSRAAPLPNICHCCQTEQNAVLYNAPSLANIKLQRNCPTGRWLGAFRLHHRTDPACIQRSATALRRRQYRPTRSHPGREESDYGCGGTVAAQSRVGEITIGQSFQQWSPRARSTDCATVDAQSSYAAYNGRQAYVVTAQMSGNRVSSAVIGLVAGGKDFALVTKMCAKYGLDPQNAS